MRIDGYRLTHWLNARKLTYREVARRAGVGIAVVEQAANSDNRYVNDGVARRIAEALEIQAAQILAEGRAALVVIKTGSQLRQTRRAVWRDGIHFYNYYSMAHPPGIVAPVILDVLCPSGRLPMLNNGHMEPALTINLGPGDIHGRWGRELTECTWSLLRANPDCSMWITGDSYVEPSYRPHSYSLASDVPARIVSYTASCGLASLIDAANHWSDSAWSAVAGELSDLSPGSLLRYALERRGYERPSTAGCGGVVPEQVEEFIGGAEDALTSQELKRCARSLGIDYRLLLKPYTRRDAIGKTRCSTAQSVASTRKFKRYVVASTASDAGLADIVGLFFRVDPIEGDAEPNLVSMSETSYLVTSGDLELRWNAEEGDRNVQRLGTDATVWLAPGVEHGWSGCGSLIQLGGGRHIGQRDLFELTNAFDPPGLLRRARRDGQAWGYDAYQPGQCLATARRMSP